MTKESKQEEVQEVDELSAKLLQASELMAKAAGDVENRDATLKKVEGILGTISAAEAPQLADSPIIQAFLGMMGSTGLKPGEVKHRGSIIEQDRELTLQEMYEMYGEKTFIPRITERIMVNGTGPVQMVLGEEICVPMPFFSAHNDIVKARQQAEKNVNYTLGQSDEPPDMSWQTPQGAQIRARATQGRERGFHAGTLGVGPIPMGDDNA